MSTNASRLPDTWEIRIEQAAKIIGKTPSELEEILKTPPYNLCKDTMGLELLSDEEATPFGDFRRLFCEQHKISLPHLRMAMKYLRGPKNNEESELSIDPDLMDLQRKYGIKTRLEDLDIEQLLPYYNPRKKNVVHDILEKRYGHKYGKFIAFKPDSEEVAVEETINYVTDLETGYSEENSIEVNGELSTLFAVGDLPFENLEEDPFCIGTPLKRGRSTANRINWADVSMELRQFWRIAYEREDISFQSAQDRITIGQLIMKPIDELKIIFPEAYSEYKTRKRANDIPKLIVSSDYIAHKRHPNNPFSIKPQIGKNRKF